MHGPAASPHPPGVRPPTALVRVLLCEDQEVYRVGLQVILDAQPDLAVVAEAPDLTAALEAATQTRAQVLVARQGLVDREFRLLPHFCRQDVAILVLGEGDAPDPELVDVLRAGVRGYLPRRLTARRLVDGVRALARHEAALDTAAADRLVRYLADGSGSPRRPVRALDQLTGRQRDVAVLVAEGLSNEEIAAQLFVSLPTVKSHLTGALRRLEIRTRTQLAILVNREGLGPV
ncbi:DNA-binding response regulator [Geodermatophilus marinus]|nr:DNA-binding response regulator [Geodermatophilus sp. LHW52908]